MSDFKIQEKHFHHEDTCRLYQYIVGKDELRFAFEQDINAIPSVTEGLGEVLLIDEPDLLIIATSTAFVVYTIKEVSSDHLS